MSRVLRFPANIDLVISSRCTNQFLLNSYNILPPIRCALNHRTPVFPLTLKISLLSNNRVATPRLTKPRSLMSNITPNIEGSRDSLSSEENPDPVSVIDEISQDISSVINNSTHAAQGLRRSKRKTERQTYLVAAVISSIGFTALAGGVIFYRFFSQMQTGGQIPYLEMLGTFSLAVGAAVGMEFWARWAHKALWHESLWHMHESHHRPREGPFELNDIFAIINALPAILLLAYGFFHKGIIPGMCFGAGLGITLFGMAYMFVHDGLVHRRFPVGPVANVPYFQKVAAAHQLHHADKYEGVPFGLFLGPAELLEVGGSDDLDAMLKIRQAQLKN